MVHFVSLKFHGFCQIHEASYPSMQYCAECFYWWSVKRWINSRYLITSTPKFFIDFLFPLESRFLGRSQLAPLTCFYTRWTQLTSSSHTNHISNPQKLWVKITYCLLKWYRQIAFTFMDHSQRDYFACTCSQVPTPEPSPSRFLSGTRVLTVIAFWKKVIHKFGSYWKNHEM